MSLLLDARNKSQQAQSAQDGGRAGSELSLEALPNTAPSSTAAPSTENARIAGKTLFNAKSSATTSPRARINRNLLIALGGTLALFSAGAGYVWYSVSAVTPALTAHPVAATLPAKPALATIPPGNNLVPGIASIPAVPAKPAAIVQAKRTAISAVKAHRQAQQDAPPLVEQHQSDALDPILSQAYLAYRNGKFDQAGQSYLEAYKLDSSNLDAILGLAVIAQRLGKDSQAAHYYAQALALDPRNAVANAGMSALTTDTNRESRLKTLLNEQPGSTALYFALGNQYAEQARWGEAQQAYFNAYRLEPNNAELAFNLAISLDHLGQKNAAVQYYQRALQLDPGPGMSFNHKQTSQRIADLTR